MPKNKKIDNNNELKINKSSAEEYDKAIKKIYEEVEKIKQQNKNIIIETKKEAD